MVSYFSKRTEEFPRGRGKATKRSWSEKERERMVREQLDGGRDLKREQQRGEGPGTLAVKKGKHTLKELTVIRPPEKLLVAWPLHGEQEKTRDVILVNTAASSCSPALTRNHFVFLFTREMNEKGAVLGNFEDDVDFFD